MTVQEFLASCRRQVRAGETQASMLDAELLLARTLAKSRSWLLARPGLALDGEQEEAVERLWHRRCSNEPLAYIMQHKEFFSLDFFVTPDVLIPRPDSELLVEAILALDVPQDARVLELGTGSGALVATLARERSAWRFVASDVSVQALQVAEENLKRHAVLERVELIQSHWLDAIPAQQFDVIFSNPPYIAINDAELDAASRQYEPDLALFAGVDGLDAYRQIFSEITAYCCKLDNPSCGAQQPTLIALEHGYSQGDALVELLQATGLKLVQQYKDLARHPRVVVCATAKTLDPQVED